MPDGVDLRAEVAALAGDQPRAEATVCGPAPARAGACAGGRRRSRRRATGWDELDGAVRRRRGRSPTRSPGYGADVVVLEPAGGARRRRAPAAGAVAGGSGRVSGGATDRLARLLALVPYLLRPAGRPACAEVARPFGVTEDQLRRGPRAALRLRAARPHARRPDRGRVGGRARPPRQRRHDRPAAAAGRRRGAGAARRAAHAGRDARACTTATRWTATLAKLERAAGDAARRAPQVAVDGRGRGRRARYRRRRGARRATGGCTCATTCPAATRRPSATSTRCGCCSWTAAATSRAGAAGPRPCGCSGSTGSTRSSCSTSPPSCRPEAVARDLDEGLFLPSPDDTVVTLELRPAGPLGRRLLPVRERRGAGRRRLLVRLRAADSRLAAHAGPAARPARPASSTRPSSPSR